jgi:hypothetical protein
VITVEIRHRKENELRKTLIVVAISVIGVAGLWGLTSRPANAAPTSSPAVVSQSGFISREQIETNARKSRFHRLDRIESKLGTMDQFLTMHQTKVVEQNVYSPSKAVWFVLFVGDIDPGRGVGVPAGELRRANWMVIAYDAGTGLAIASRTGGGPLPTGWTQLIDLAK